MELKIVIGLSFCIKVKISVIFNTVIFLVFWTKFFEIFSKFLKFWRFFEKKVHFEAWKEGFFDPRLSNQAQFKITFTWSRLRNESKFLRIRRFWHFKLKQIVKNYVISPSAGHKSDLLFHRLKQRYLKISFYSRRNLYLKFWKWKNTFWFERSDVP